MDNLKWREAAVDSVLKGSVVDATDALLDLTYNESDRTWLQGLLLQCLDVGRHPQVRALAVTCVGHVARIDHEIESYLIEKLFELKADPNLTGIVEDALSDIASFVPGCEL